MLTCVSTMRGVDREGGHADQGVADPLTVDRLIGALARGRRAPDVLVVVAHPDDEVLWLGATIADRDLTLVHLTDGAPRDPWFATAAGCTDHRAYAALRARELEAALAVLGLSDARRAMLAARDQEAALELLRLTRALTDLLMETRPDVVIAQAYDGGHPDHDAAAFVARAAIARIRPRPVLLDMAGYHAGRGEDAHEIGFLTRPENTRARALVLDRAQRERKARALACFRSQRDVIATLDASIERLRPGAREDFASPPHPGRLHYESHGWALDGPAFRRHALAAAQALELPAVLP